MILNGSSLGNGAVVETDICIIGAGAAGITLAMEFLNSGYRVVLLESGGLDLESEVQALNQGSCVSEWKIDPEWTRLRQFGGTTMHWGGNCSPLDPWDFEARDWVKDSGWPFGRDELDKVYSKAFSYCQLPSDQYDAGHWATVNDDFGARRMKLGDKLREKIYLKSPPTRFGEVYRAALDGKDRDCLVFLNTHVAEIETDDSGAVVTGVSVLRPGSVMARVTARAFVLAGGMENARLLLLSDRIIPNGLGNGYDTVGRWFMTHLAFTSGTAVIDIADGAAHYYGLSGWEARFQSAVVPFAVGIQPTEQEQRNRRMLNAVVFLDESYGGERSPGFKALRRIVKRALYGQVPDDLSGDLAKVLSDVDDIASALYGRFTGDARYRVLELGYFSEQAPNRDSRLRLGDKLDFNGQRELVIDWQPSEIDKHTILETQKLLASEFGRMGLGRIKVDFSEMSDPWPKVPDSAAHFMGSTRMHDDPKQGVVNRNCRVHGMENLYIAGGSVFPTSGSAMVTMNIVALSVRLARHMIEKLSHSASNH
jgi:choline dehydrogenase-like flavoprotein